MRHAKNNNNKYHFDMKPYAIQSEYFIKNDTKLKKFNFASTIICNDLYLSNILSEAIHPDNLKCMITFIINLITNRLLFIKVHTLI